MNITEISKLANNLRHHKLKGLLTFEFSLGLIRVRKNNAKKFMNPQKRSVMDPREKGLDSTTLPSDVM